MLNCTPRLYIQRYYRRSFSLCRLHFVWVGLQVTVRDTDTHEYASGGQPVRKRTRYHT